MEELVKIAFYKGPGLLRDRFIRLWTRSRYSHVELVIDDRNWWLGIRPPESPSVRKNIVNTYNENHWDFIEIFATKEQVEKIVEFYNKTNGMDYDWVGMVLSHISPFRIKHTEKWYCSEWVIYALEYAGLLGGELYDKNKLPPEFVYKLLSKKFIVANNVLNINSYHYY